jgi:hypothetical protein
VIHEVVVGVPEICVVATSENLLNLLVVDLV